MPLISTGQPGVPTQNERGLGFWMRVDGAPPVQGVRVFVTYEALWEMAPTKARDLVTAAETFEADRNNIELVASQRFDAGAINEADGLFEGMPILILRSVDF
jgi:hypothetical protein